ncbi:MAG: hypothetical protein K2O02_02490 [Lachnospiraceae bacterium]|nr:hypothetical protein [Lachnospiraceae bacterium]
MGEMTKWSEEEKQAWAVSKLLEKQAETGRLPHKDDFDVVTLSRIKAFLGPWPHALVKAGLKEAKPRLTKKKKRAARKAASPTSRRQGKKISAEKGQEKDNET